MNFPLATIRPLSDPQLIASAETRTKAPLEISRIPAKYFSDAAVQQSQQIEIFWFTSGTCHIMVDMESHQVYAGMVLCLRPGEVYRISSGKDLEGFLIRFQTEFLVPGSELFSDTMLNLAQSRIVRVDAVAERMLFEIVQSMYRELQYSYHQQKEVLRGFLRIFSIYLSRQNVIIIQASPKPSPPALVKRFFELLERHYKSKKKVFHYADALSVTSNYLNEIIKRESGLSVSAQIRKRLALEAKRMAVIQNISLKEIAYDLGFEDIAHFSKFFKQECGCTFTNFRKMIFE
jgi:AraC-like DNA-binding protein